MGKAQPPAAQQGGSHGVATMQRTIHIVTFTVATTGAILELPRGAGEGTLLKAAMIVHRINLNQSLVAGLAPHLEPKRPAAVTGHMYANLLLGRFEDVELRRPSAGIFSAFFERFSLPEHAVPKALFPNNVLYCWVFWPHSQEHTTHKQNHQAHTHSKVD